MGGGDKMLKSVCNQVQLQISECKLKLIYNIFFLMSGIRSKYPIIRYLFRI